MTDRAAHASMADERHAEQRAEHRLVSRTVITEAGIAAGTVAGVLMIAFETAVAVLQGASPLRTLYAIAATFYGPDALVGGVTIAVWGGLLHLAVAAALGCVFAWIVGPYPHGADALGWGIAYGLGVMFLMTYLVLPWANPTLFLRVPQMTAAWVLGHIVFGVCLSFAPAYIRRS